jgi:uncharacterized protein (DUF1697 family)
MAVHVALLRAVNVAGHNKVAMRDLVGLLERIGMQDGRSLLQSGNLVFRSDVTGRARLERRLEEATAEHLGVETDYFVRNARDWKGIVVDNPFPGEARRDPGHLLVMFLKQAADRPAIAALQKAIVGREVVRAGGDQAYIYYPDGVGRSRLTTTVIEKHLGTRTTSRNWNTILKLGAMIEGL